MPSSAISPPRLFSGWLVLTLLVGLSHPVSAADLQVRRDISYVDTPRADSSGTLDIYAPKAGKNLPVMIFIHGGGWRYGDKNMVDIKPRVFAEKQYVFVSLNYRLHPQADFRDQAADVAEAIAWVHKHIDTYSGDPERLTVMGHSAGAHLAALIGADERYLQREGLNPSHLSGIILLDGACYDIPQHIVETPTLVQEFFKLVFTSDVSIQKDASPLFHVKAGKNIPPFLILYVANRPDATSQSTRLAKALEQAGVPVELYGDETANHVSISRDIGLPNRPVTTWVSQFLDREEDLRNGLTK